MAERPVRSGRPRIGSARWARSSRKQSGKTVSHINVYCAYDFNSGTVWFDNIALRQEPVQTYRYDEKGNVTAATQTGTGTENAQYDSNGVDLLQYTAANGTKYSYEYNNANDVTKTTVGSLTATTSYNKSGNTTGARLVGKDSNENDSPCPAKQRDPTADRNHTASVTDARQHDVPYLYRPRRSCSRRRRTRPGGRRPMNTTSAAAAPAPTRVALPRSYTLFRRASVAARPQDLLQRHGAAPVL